MVLEIVFSEAAKTVTIEHALQVFGLVSTQPEVEDVAAASDLPANDAGSLKSRRLSAPPTSNRRSSNSSQVDIAGES